MSKKIGDAEITDGDAYAVLGLPRRPSVDPERIAGRFRSLAIELHPDAPGGDAGRFATLSEARRILLNPASRLMHLAGLIGGPDTPAGPPPDPELAFRTGDAIRRMRGAREAVNVANSVIAKAVAARRLGDARNALNGVVAEVSTLVNKLEAHLADVDARWPDVEAGELAALAAGFRYAARWQSQCAEILEERA